MSNNDYINVECTGLEEGFSYKVVGTVLKIMWPLKIFRLDDKAQIFETPFPMKHIAVRRCNIVIGIGAVVLVTEW